MVILSFHLIAEHYVARQIRINIQALAGGTYAHYGLEKALKEQLRYVLLQCTSDMRIPVTLQININIDGLPSIKEFKKSVVAYIG